MPDEQTAVVIDAPPISSEAGSAQAEEQRTFSADYVKALRAENADWRRQLRETQTVVKQLQDGQASAADLSAKLTALEAQLAEKDKAAAQAQQEAALVRLATKAGVDPEVASMLDLSKIDLADETKALASLQKLAGAGRSTAQAKPGTVGQTGLTEAELHDRFFGSGGQKATIFG